MNYHNDYIFVKCCSLNRMKGGERKANSFLGDAMRFNPKFINCVLDTYLVRFGLLEFLSLRFSCHVTSLDVTSCVSNLGI